MAPQPRSSHRFGFGWYNDDTMGTIVGVRTTAGDAELTAAGAHRTVPDLTPGRLLGPAA